MRHLFFSLSFFSVCAGLPAAVQPNPLFSDHMVLQRDMPLPVWGEAAAGETIRVQLGERASGEVVAGPDGRWMVVLPPQSASAEPVDLIIRGSEEIRVRDVLIGEVWLGAGQSNMFWPVARTLDAQRVAAAAERGDYDGIRLFQVRTDHSDTPKSSVPSMWRTVTPESAKGFYGTLFYFGEALRRANPEVPVGLIASAVGGTNAHSWIAQDVLESAEAGKITIDWYRKTLEDYPTAKARYEEDLAAFEARKAEGGNAGRAPMEPMHAAHPKRPAAHFNAMIAPLIPYAVRGVLWYQGEANSREPWVSHYAELMETLITSWRQKWASAAETEPVRDIPFLIVQLPNFNAPANALWPELREQQMEITRRVPETGMIVSIDIGDPGDIHPANKTPIGERLALLARERVYGDDVNGTSPTPDDVKFGDGWVVVKFESADELKTTDGAAPRNFEVAGSDGNFHAAEAEILDGTRVQARSEAVPEPVAVRYAWQKNPQGINLVGANRLPVSPFRLPVPIRE